MRSQPAIGLTTAFVLSSLSGASSCLAQTEQKGIDRHAGLREKLRVEYVHFRPARYETEAVTEIENERPNKGGLVFVYLRNVTDKPVRLAFYRVNGKDESHWLLGGFLAWHRLYDEHLEPGEMTVLELNALTEHFSGGKPFSFVYVDRTWKPACIHGTRLEEDPVQISLLRILPAMREVEVHVRHTGTGTVKLSTLEVIGHETEHVEWRGRTMQGKAYAIARMKLAKPLASSELTIVRLGINAGGKTRTVYAHRRAFVDWFPIGCWSAKPGTYRLLRSLHIELVVQGGTAESPFYKEIAGKLGFRTMCPTGKFWGLDTMRSLEDHPAVACWMLSDEPDWSTPSVVMKYSDDFARRYNKTKPTFITLCRNVKFFEYATIADIPCMDHYAVTAPSSSKWPKPYGTRLEETAYYTRDLRIASEPKPIWIWSQAIAGWDERPKRPVPTPKELASQLLFNLGRGAKGIIWFNYQHEVAERFPDTREAMKRWGRVMRVLRDDLLTAEPADLVASCPPKVDVAPLVSWDKLIVCANNLDYDIHPEAYPFRTQKGVSVEVALPPWIRPKACLAVSPAGVTDAPYRVEGRSATVELGDLEVCKLVVLVNDPSTRRGYEARYQQALGDERTYRPKGAP